MNPLRVIPINGTMTYGQMRTAIYASHIDVVVASEPLGGIRMGYYCETTRTIIIDRNMTYRQKRCALMHELVHWAHGDQACDNIHAARERRTRLETARRLVDMDEYRTAENVYQGNAWLIADELDVPIQVINVIQEWLHDSATV